MRLAKAAKEIAAGKFRLVTPNVKKAKVALGRRDMQYLSIVLT